MKTNWLALVGFILVLSGAVRAQERVTVDHISDLTVRLGHSAPLNFTIHIRPGFHVNSHKPITPELIPPEMFFTPPEDLVIAKVRYPAGEEMSFPFDPPNQLPVYSRDLTMPPLVLPPP